MNGLMDNITAIALAIVGVATLAVIVSKNADTANVIKSSGQAFSQALGTALTPVTGFAGGGYTFPIN